MSIRQLDLDAQLPGTYPNTSERAQMGLKLNRFCYDLRLPENRALYKSDPDGQMERYALDEEDRRLIRAKDWLGLVRRGGNVFPLLRLAQMHGDNLEAVAAQMRGETVEEYMASRDFEMFGAAPPKPKGG